MFKLENLLYQLSHSMFRGWLRRSGKPANKIQIWRALLFDWSRYADKHSLSWWAWMATLTKPSYSTTIWSKPLFALRVRSIFHEMNVKFYLQKCLCEKNVFILLFE